MTETAPVEQPEGFHSHFVERVVHYGPIDSAFQTAKSLYTQLKESNTVLKFGFETAENNLPKIATPFAHALGHKITEWAEPVLTPMDEFGVRQLNKLEQNVFPPTQKVAQLPYVVLDRVLDVTEGTMDYWLPPNAKTLQQKQEEEESDKGKGKEGSPIPPNFQQLGTRFVGQLSTLYSRTKDRINVYFPFLVVFLNFFEQQLHRVRNVTQRLWQVTKNIFANLLQYRHQAINYGKNVLNRFSRILFVAVAPVFRLFQTTWEKAKQRTKTTVNRVVPEPVANFASKKWQSSYDWTMHTFPAFKRLVDSIYDFCTTNLAELKQKVESVAPASATSGTAKSTSTRPATPIPRKGEHGAAKGGKRRKRTDDKKEGAVDRLDPTLLYGVEESSSGK